MFFFCFLLMRSFTKADSPGLLLVIGAELLGFFSSLYYFFFLSSSSFYPQSFWSASDWEETQPTSDYLPAFPGSFHHFNSLTHDSFTLGHFTHSYICSCLRIIFLAFFSSRSGACSCQFHGGPVLGESPRALETIKGLLPLPQIKKKIKQAGVLGNKPFTSLSVSVKKLNGYYF